MVTAMARFWVREGIRARIAIFLFLDKVTAASAKSLLSIVTKIRIYYFSIPD